MPHLIGNSNFSFARSRHLDRLAVIHMHEFRADDPLEFRDQPLLDPLVEQGEILLPFVQQRREGVFQQRLRQRLAWIEFSRVVPVPKSGV
jgi:hypothetical protein